MKGTSKKQDVINLMKMLVKVLPGHVHLKKKWKPCHVYQLAKVILYFLE